ncbi:restriction endonuclease subunit S [Pseudoxanthomonas sp. PXM04]|uniref:restriction endonuclease subunit S n=1 Tax=Pseudoxanthomonas sp. PXM04 TaxID=2769297 RepID=UPI001783DBC5|nr:restriction endonuclease subunit S [Pseudoxanthomonas sp. PXM04]MBD9379428.1 restriction endonuclease subunit S [Pseudoxanthomonas sp. PXM04]
MEDANIEWVSLGDLMDAGAIQVTTGFPFGGHNESGEGVPHIRPFNVGTDGDIYLNQIKSIPTSAAAGKPKLQPRDIVFNNTNTKELVGKCAIWSSELHPVFSNHMTRIRVAEPSYDPAYLNFAILHHWMAGKSEMLARSHVAQASIIGARFREIEVPRRPFEEQRIIGTLVEQVRASSRSEAAQLEQAQELKRAAMARLFTRGLRGEVQKETEIGLMPQSWEVVSLGSLGKIGNGSTPKRTVPAYWVGGKFPWLTSAKVYDREIEQADQFVTETALEGCHLPRVKPGAVLMAITGQGKTLGHCAVLNIEATISQHVAYVQTDIERAVPGFVRGYLETQYDNLRQVASGGGSTKGALTCAFLKDLPFPLPLALDEQREIVAILDALDRKIALHRQKRAVLEEMFQALLHKLMNGEIRVADLDLSTLTESQATEVAA